MTRKPCVLLIEDERDIVRAINIRLRAAGFEVIVAYDGESGVAAASAKQPDVIVLDIRMPGMDGLAALAKLRGQEATRRIPTIVHSANVTERTKTKAFELGSRYVLQKPCDSSALIQAIQSVVASTTQLLP